MAIRGNHYDRAFEEFLRVRGTPHVVVDEAKRALLADESLKSMDFIVHAPRGNLLVDVKGRRFPSGEQGHTWENWTTDDDLESLDRWESIFGGDFRAVLVFAYDLVDERHATRFERLFDFRDHRYAFFGVEAAEYAAVARRRSSQWGTVAAGRAEFRRLRRPIEEFLSP